MGILKGIGAIIGLFIFLALLGAVVGPQKMSTPVAPVTKPAETKTAFTKDGVNFISKDRVDENIKVGFAKPGDYKEVQVPLNTVVVGGYAPSDEAIQNSRVQQTTSSVPTQTTSSQDQEWAKRVRETNTKVSQDYDILYQAAANYQFDKIKRYCTDLRTITDSSLQTSKDYEVSPQYQAAKNSYETAMQEFHSGCNKVLDGLDAMSASKMYAGRDQIMNGKNYLDKAMNLLPQ